MGGIQGIVQLNRCDVREGTLSLADPVNLSQGHASSEESNGKHVNRTSWPHGAVNPVN